jgi:hypothetical protein
MTVNNLCHAAGDLPFAGVSALDDQDPAGVVGDDGGDADGVAV